MSVSTTQLIIIVTGVKPTVNYYNWL